MCPLASSSRSIRIVAHGCGVGPVRPESGVSISPELTQVTPHSLDHNPVAVLRFPQITLTMWYRVAELSYGRGLLPATKYRLARFLSQQELDSATGRVVGQWGTGRTDGGMTLAARYAWQVGVGEDRFWDDLKGLYRYGFAARVVAPAPGRRAVYASCCGPTPSPKTSRTTWPSS